MIGWSARALAQQTRLPVSTLASWISRGLITPDHRGRGRGGHTIGVAGLLELTAVLALREAGISTERIEEAVRNLRLLSGVERPLARLTLVVQGEDILWRDAHEVEGMTLSTLHKPGQRLMVFPVGEQHAEMLLHLEENHSAEMTTGSKRPKKELSRVA